MSLDRVAAVRPSLLGRAHVNTPHTVEPTKIAFLCTGALSRHGFCPLLAEVLPKTRIGRVDF